LFVGWRETGLDMHKSAQRTTADTEIEHKKREKEVHLETKTILRTHMMPMGLQSDQHCPARGTFKAGAAKI